MCTKQDFILFFFTDSICLLKKLEVNFLIMSNIGHKKCLGVVQYLKLTSISHQVFKVKKLYFYISFVQCTYMPFHVTKNLGYLSAYIDFIVSRVKIFFIKKLMTLNKKIYFLNLFCIALLYTQFLEQT